MGKLEANFKISKKACRKLDHELTAKLVSAALKV